MKNTGLILTTLDFNHVTVTDEQAATMRAVVTANAHDPADAALLMAALGVEPA